jgi:sarcosine oxidase, subunit beta
MTDLPPKADAVVIGGGIVGAASAFFLARLGLRPVLIERLPALASLATAQSMEAFRAQFVEPENIAMMRAGIEFYERFAEETGLDQVDLGLRQQGYLFLTTQEDGPERFRARVEIQHALGLDDVDYLEAEEAHRRFPFVTGKITAATYRAKDGWLSAHEAAYGFVRASHAAIVLDTTALGFRSRGGRLQAVETDRGSIDTPLAVIAGGAYSKQLAALVGADLPLENVRRHRVTIGGHPLIPQQAPMTIDQDTGAHWRPESGGAALAWAQTHERPQPPTDHVHPDPNFPFAVLEGAARLCSFWEAVGNSLKANQVHLGAGHYTLTPDDKPIIGPQPGIEGVYFNVGYGGHGVMGAPGGGGLLARLVADPGLDATNPFSVRRLEKINEVDRTQRRML